MIAVVKCPQCGKTARFDPSDPAAGMKHLCVACGSVFNASAELAAGRGQVEKGTLTATVANRDEWSFPSESLPRRGTVAPPRKRRKADGVPLWAVVACGFVVLTAAAAIIAVISGGGR